MDETPLRDAVRAWYESPRRRIEPPPRTVHLDELLGGRYDRDDAVAQGLVCFRALHECWRDDDVVPLLVVCLRESERIECAPCSWAEAQRHLGDTPPSLYLLDPMANWLSWSDEEYRCGVQVPADPALPEGCASFFRSHRSAEDRSRGETFAADLTLAAGTGRWRATGR